MTGTPSRSSSRRSGAITASAAPSQSGVTRTDTAAEDSTGATVTCSCRLTPQLLRAVPSIWIMPSCASSDRSARATATVRPVTFRTSPGGRRCVSGRPARAAAIAWPISSTRGFRHAQRHRGGQRVWPASGARSPGGVRSSLGLEQTFDLPCECLEDSRELLLVGMIGGSAAMATEVRSRPASFSRMVPRLVCSMAQPRS